jgi:outer membrane lipoprotein carrier protein
VVTAAGAIVEMKVEEIDGATTEFAFSDSQENVPAKDSDFVFTVPPGVTVVNGGPPL